MNKKIVDYSRNYGEVKVRTGKQYVSTADKDINNYAVITPENTGEFEEKFGKFNVENIYQTNEVFSDFSVSILPAANVPSHDEHYEDMAYNQEHCSLTEVSDGVYKIETDAELVEFSSSVAAEGTHKWVAIAIGTGESSIIGMKWNGNTLTEDDVADSESVNLPDGSIIYWYKADLGGTTNIITNENKSIVLTIN